MNDFEKIEKLCITSKEEYEQIKKDFRECKTNAERLEWFLYHLVEAFQPEYRCL